MSIQTKDPIPLLNEWLDYVNGKNMSAPIQETEDFING